MRKFIRKYYQELIAVGLVIGFWSGVYAYHSYQAQQQAFQNANTVEFSNSLIEPPSPSPTPAP